MKKKSILFIIVAILAAFIVIKIAMNFPPTGSDVVSGTIGKVDKYRKVQLTENDIILRKEFISDTSKLAKSIRGLVYYNAFIKDYAADLKVYSDFLKKNNPGMKYVKEMEEYITFIKDNSGSVENTIGFLLDIYSNDTTSYSTNSESKLKAFDSFAYQVMKKDSSVTLLISELEKEIGSMYKKQPVQKDAIKKLKNIHDQLILKEVQLNCMAGTKISVKSALNKPLYDVRNNGLYESGSPSIDSYANFNLGSDAINWSAQMNKEVIGNCFGSATLENSPLPAARVFNSNEILKCLSFVYYPSNEGNIGNTLCQDQNQSLGIDNFSQQLGAGFTNNFDYFAGLIVGSSIVSNQERLNSFLISALNNSLVENKSLGHDILLDVELENHSMGNHSMGNQSLGNQGRGD